MAGKELAAYVHIGGRSFKPGDVPPKEYAEQITNPLAWGEGDDAASDDGTEAEGKPYPKWTVPELEAEIDRRNDGRGEDDLIEAESGRKDDLVAALQGDDAASS